MRINEEQTNFWHDATLDNLELLHATYVTHSFVPHSHEGYAIGVIEQGAERFAYRGAEHIAGAGSVVLVNPAEVHTGQAHTPQGWTYRMLYPAAEQLRQVAAQMTDKVADYPFFPTAVVQDFLVAHQLVELHKQLERGIDPLTSETLWLTLLTALIARHADAHQRIASPTSGTGHWAIQRALTYLHDCYADAISLHELATLVHLSPYHFVRLFKAELGLPPHTYLTQLRIERAKGLLHAGLPIAAVAQQVGFTDQSHLTRHFKRIVGVPPGQYRRG